MLTDLKSVVERVIADYELRTGEKANANQVIEALLASYGAAAHAIYRYIDNRLLQLFPKTADSEWLALWGERTGVTRKNGESLDAWRKRIELALQERNRFGRTEDYIAWCIVYDDIKFAYVNPNTPILGATTVVLGSYSELTTARKLEIHSEIKAKIHAGSALYIKQSALQLVNLTIKTASAHRTAITNILSEFIAATNSTHNAVITIAQLHSKIDVVTNAYTLVAPTSKITAQNDNYLKLGTITWQ